MDQLDVSATDRGEELEVSSVRCDDVVPVVGQDNDSRVDHVGQAGRAEQGAGLPPQPLVQRTNVDTVQSLRQARLATISSPDLA